MPLKIQGRQREVLSLNFQKGAGGPWITKWEDKNGGKKKRSTKGVG